MEKGHPVDIVTGKPRKDEQSEGEQAKDLELQAKARFAGIAETTAGMLLLQEVEACLIRRVVQLMAENDECKAYVNLLTTLGYKQDAGRKAVEQLTKRLKLQ
jgi:DNA/RNA-binding domain of Phe-tRNA-synthetase-like protein